MATAYSDPYQRLANDLVGSMSKIAAYKSDKASYDKSFAVTILGINQKFTGDVPIDDRQNLITKYSIPETTDDGEPKYFTIKINGTYYVTLQNANFKLYDKIMAYIPNGDWSRMYLDYQLGGKGETVSLPHNFISGIEPEEGMVEGDYWYQVDENNAIQAKWQYLPDDETGELQWWFMFDVISGVGEEIGNHSVRFNENTNTVSENQYSGYNVLDGRDNTLINCNKTRVGGNDNTGTSDSQCIIDGNNNDSSLCGSSIISGGYNTNTDDDYCIDSGQQNTTSGNSDNFTSGYGNDVQNCQDGITTGKNNTANHASRSINAGAGNNATATDSLTVGINNIADQGCAITTGEGNKAAYKGITVGSFSEYESGNRIVVGNGSDANNRSNAFYVTYDGTTYAKAYNTTGADYAEYFEWAIPNVDRQDRRGMLVTFGGTKQKTYIHDDMYNEDIEILQSDKIVLANGDDILGAVSCRPSVVGNAYEEHWRGKYKTDIYGALILDKDGMPQLSDEYDPEREYVPRSQRPEEWAVVGIFGRLVVCDNGYCEPGKPIIALDGIAVPALQIQGEHTPYIKNVMVLKRIDKNHIEVLIK